MILAEILAIELRKNPNLKGILIHQISKVLGQFADDIDLYLWGKKQNVDEAIKTIKLFGDHSGFRISYEKTTLYKMGNLKKSDAKWYSKQGINKNVSEINVLGVIVTKSNALLPKNYEPLIEKTQAILRLWKKHRLDLFAKVLVINTLIAFLFVYKMTVLPNMTETMFKKLDSVMEDFLWDGKKAKIPLRVLQANKYEGGAGLVNFRLKQVSLKASWVKILKTDTFLADITLSKLKMVNIGEKIWECNLSPKDTIKLAANGSFWHEVLVDWTKLNYVNEVGESDVAKQCLWYNSHIKAGGQVLFMKKAFDEGLVYVNQLFDGTSGKILPYEVAHGLFELKIMEYNTLISAIPLEWKRMMPRIIQANRVALSEFQQFIVRKHEVSYYYKKVNSTLCILKELYQKWNRKFPTLGTDFDTFCEAFVNIFK